VDQIKEVLIPARKKNYAREMRLLSHDIDLLAGKRKLKLSSRTIRIIVALAQLNLHIWYIKERMQKEPKKYLRLLKLAHQLNGLRNQMKNLLLEEAQDKSKSSVRTNFNTDGLKGWRISI
jgi:hypothetical protein